MATVPTTIHQAARGIAKTLAGFVIQDYSITENPIAEQIPDQNGAIAEEQVYDHRFDLSLSVFSASSARTAPAHQNDVIAFDGNNWQVDSVAEAGNYQTVTRWTIAAHRYDNCPSQT